MSRERKNWLLRLTIQIAFLVVFVLFLVNFQPNRSFMLVAAVAILVITLFLRTGFCGWICPLGTVMDLVRKIGAWFGGLRFIQPLNRRYRRFIRNNREVLNKLDKYARVLKYLFLIWILQAAIFSIATIKEEGEHGLFAVLPVVIGFVLLGLFVERAWCKYLCPVSAVIGIVGRVSFSQIERNEESCIKCNKCTRICSINIDVANKIVVKNLDCNTCLKCVDVCPVDQTLDLRFKFIEKAKIKSPVYGTVITILLIGTMVVTNLLGVWDAPSQKGTDYPREHVEANIDTE